MCGIASVFNVPHAYTRLAEAGVTSLQPRGDDGSGIALSDDRELFFHRAPGKTTACIDTFPGAHSWKRGSTSGIMHTRYGTGGDYSAENIQPLPVYSERFGWFALAVNGDTRPNEVSRIRHELAKRGVTVRSGSSDTWAIGLLIATSTAPTLLEAITREISGRQGAFALVILTPTSLIAARDPYGIRPLCFGTFSGGGLAIASEEAVLYSMDASFCRDISPGEILRIGADNAIDTRWFRGAGRVTPKQCAIENFYLKAPSSRMDGAETDVATFRRSCGHQFVRELPPDVRRQIRSQTHALVPIPNSGTLFGKGVAEALDMETRQGFYRPDGIGRTFIHQESDRDEYIRLKFQPIASALRGAHVVLLDDTLIRGSTLTRIVSLVRTCRPKSVSVWVGAPQNLHPCFDGISMKTYAELIAARHYGETDSIREEIGADDLRYLSQRGARTVFGYCGINPDHVCLACFDGRRAF